MPSGSHDLLLMTLTNFIAYWFTRGISTGEAVSMAYKKFGEVFRGYEQSAIQSAQRATRNSMLANSLDPSKPLSEVMEGNQPPYTTVAVRVLIKATSSFTGDSMLGSKVIESTWTNSVQNVLNEALARMCRDHPSWCNAIEPTFEIISPMLFPQSTQF